MPQTVDMICTGPKAVACARGAPYPLSSASGWIQADYKDTDLGDSNFVAIVTSYL